MSDINLLEEDRFTRLSDIVSHLTLTQDFPLLKAVEIPSVDFNNLRSVIIYYLFSNLSRFYKNKKFELCNDILDRYTSQIKGLPNVTPNGLILPKKEVLMEYNLVHRCVAKIFEEMGFSSVLETVHVPINIRLVDGNPNPALDSRPRSSTKIHSDIWAGEPLEAVMIFLPVLGDVERVGVKFFEPKVFPGSVVQPLDDYLDGAFVAEGAREYHDVKFTKGELILTDPFLLHQTVKSASTLRLSIDFRFIAKKKVSSDSVFRSPRLGNYVSLDDWCDYGTGRLLVTDSPLEKFRGGDIVKNDYAANFNTVNIIGL